MTKQPRKTRYSSSNYIQDIFGFICNHILSCSKPGQKYIVEEYFDHQSIDESQEVIPTTVEYVHAHTPVHIPEAPEETLVRHKPPALSPPPAVSYSAESLDVYKPPALSPTPAEPLDVYKPPALSPALVKSLDGSTPLVTSPVLAKVPDRYKPLDLPPILHDLPANYIDNLPRFDGENAKITAEKHMQNLEDFLDLYEVEDDDVYIRMFALSLGGKVKDWFKNLPAASIRNFQQFMQVFLDRWVVRGNVFLHPRRV
jgi:hypothetical protein